MSAREPIRLGRLTDAQIAVMGANSFHLESKGDGTMGYMRTVWPALNMAGKWFDSTNNATNWDHFGPSVPWSK